MTTGVAIYDDRSIYIYMTTGVSIYDDRSIYI